MSQTGKQMITIHIMSNICKSKGNQTIKFGQLTEYNMRNILFFEKSYKKCGRVPDLFLKNQNRAYL